MLKLVNTFGMDEIELYIEQVLVQPQVREQLLGNFTQLLLGQMIMLRNLSMVVDLVVPQLQ